MYVQSLGRCGAERVSRGVLATYWLQLCIAVAERCFCLYLYNCESECTLLLSIMHCCDIQGYRLTQRHAGLHGVYIRIAPAHYQQPAKCLHVQRLSYWCSFCLFVCYRRSSQPCPCVPFALLSCVGAVGFVVAVALQQLLSFFWFFCFFASSGFPLRGAGGGPRPYTASACGSMHCLCPGLSYSIR